MPRTRRACGRAGRPSAAIGSERKRSTIPSCRSVAIDDGRPHRSRRRAVCTRIAADACTRGSCRPGRGSRRRTRTRTAARTSAAAGSRRAASRGSGGRGRGCAALARACRPAASAARVSSAGSVASVAVSGAATSCGCGLGGWPRTRARNTSSRVASRRWTSMASTPPRRARARPRSAAPRDRTGMMTLAGAASVATGPSANALQRGRGAIPRSSDWRR